MQKRTLPSGAGPIAERAVLALVRAHVDDLKSEQNRKKKLAKIDFLKQTWCLRQGSQSQQHAVVWRGWKFNQSIEILNLIQKSEKIYAQKFSTI